MRKEISEAELPATWATSRSAEHAELKKVLRRVAILRAKLSGTRGDEYKAALNEYALFKAGPCETCGICGRIRPRSEPCLYCASRAKAAAEIGNILANGAG